MEEKFDCKKIRDYFGGKKSKLPLILLIIGICTAAFGIGFLFMIAAVIMWFVNIFSSNFTNEDEVDRATKYQISQAEKRALEKLGLVKEEISLIEPITTSGQAPKVLTATDVINAKQNSKGLLGKIFGRKKVKADLLKNDDDPKYFVRIGSDSNLRYTLLHNTVFFFGANQIFVYWEYIDIATGIVYEAGTHEYFYSDIVEIAVSQSRSKQFVPKKKEYVRYINEYMSINLTSGKEYTTGFRAYTEGSTNNQEIESKIMAMRNLVRDKKVTA